MPAFPSIHSGARAKNVSVKTFLLILAGVPALGLLPLLCGAQTTVAGLSPVLATGTPDLSQYKTADALWSHILELRKGPGTRAVSQARYRAAMAACVSQILAGATDFLARFPNDPRRWNARLLQLEMGSQMNQLAGGQGEAGMIQQLQDLSDRMDAPTAICERARCDLLELALWEYRSGNQSVTAASIAAEFNKFAADFPTFASLEILKQQVIQTVGRAAPPATGQAATGQAATGPDPKDGELKERLKSPLDLRFTAVDGTPVDLASMRGKVVLVDFWATWCGPCKAEVPKVVAAYNKLHDKGFEIVGVSLDHDLKSLLEFTAANGMTWPQYFDGKGWQNSISSGFGVHAIPAMWLVNKNGYVVSTEGTEDLEGQVEKLLTE
jgi:thiol-disulfide isomerase/thioredoxin